MSNSGEKIIRQRWGGITWSLGLLPGDEIEWGIVDKRWRDDRKRRVTHQWRTSSYKIYVHESHPTLVFVLQAVSPVNDLDSAYVFPGSL